MAPPPALRRGTFRDVPRHEGEFSVSHHSTVAAGTVLSLKDVEAVCGRSCMSGLLPVLGRGQDSGELTSVCIPGF